MTRLTRGRSAGLISQGRKQRVRCIILVLTVVAISLVPAASLSSALAKSAPSAPSPAVAAVALGGSLERAPLAPSDTIVPGSQALGKPGTTSLNILITLELSNQSALDTLLAQLSDSTSSLYHHYLTSAEFNARFSPPIEAWSGVLTYVRGFDITNLTTTPDRVSIAFDATPSVADVMFHTSIEQYVVGGFAYEAPATAPQLPSGVTAVLAQVEGLSTYPPHEIHTATGGLSTPSQRPIAPIHIVPVAPQGYLAPATYNGVQLEYAPDFQVAYDEQSLFQLYGYPTNATVATILWSGSYAGSPSTKSTVCGSPVSYGEDVGPWVPSDIYNFYNETLPSGEPHSTLTAVPIAGAAEPGCLSSYDTTGAVGENTLDLEMVGSTAPGSQIYNVYGPSPAYLDQAFATILSPSGLPPAVEAGLNNVTAISNSWGGSDGYDSSWYSSLQQAQVRGISVLASSGDSDDNAASQKYTGTTVEFPSSMAYNDFGTTAVGGTTVTLDPTTLQLQRQVAWNISAADSNDGGPAGSTGGISLVFSEPSWQLSTEANSVLQGAGRGVPDLAAIANNTLMTITSEGYQYKATNASSTGPFEWAWGTSIASPLTAGLVAEIDHVLAATGNHLLGFLNPMLYSIANLEYTPLPTYNGEVGADITGSYNYSLPTTPLRDVTSGSNYLYATAFAYDLVTGWGSLDAYNYTMYVLQNSSPEILGRLSGVQDRLDLTGLNVYSTGSTDVYNASTQQNFFLANSLGAPVYWIQNVVYISNGTFNDQPIWGLTFTGWVVFPFYAAYPSLTVYEYDFPTNTYLEFTPFSCNFTTQLTSPGTLGAEVHFAFGNVASNLTLPVPGAAFIIGSLNYSYSWQGTTYINGGPAYSPGEGFLSPQFGLVGGPSLGLGHFQPPTGGNLSAWVDPLGSTGFVPAATQTFGRSNTQTGEDATGLSFTQTSGNAWKIGTQTGSSTQGVLCYEQSGYAVKFLETGLPASTSWSVTLGGVKESSTTSTIVFTEANGTYPYSVGVISGWHQSTLPYVGNVTVAGAGLTEPTLTFTRVTYPLGFTETGLPTGGTWYVNFTFGPTGFTLPRGSALAGFSISVSLANGTYQYTVATNEKRFETSVTNRVMEAAGNPSALQVTFTFTYTVNFSETGLPLGTSWSVSLGGTLVSSTTTVVNFTEANGSYPYAITDIPGWRQGTLNYSGTVNVPGTAVTEPTLFFAPVTYNITFTESALPSGTEWWVNLTSGPAFNSTNASLSFAEPNGTYNYTVATGDRLYDLVPTNGSFDVNGTTVGESVTFQLVTYVVTFTETGLPTGTEWWVNVNGTPSIPSSTATLTLHEPNGTWDYSVVTANQEYSSPGGLFGLHGAPLSVEVSFALVTYPVLFMESGLPNGTTWYVNLTDGPSHTSTSDTIGFAEPNGTYGYTVATTDKEDATRFASGSFDVSGAAASEGVSFALVVFPVTFTETGLPSGVSWSVSVNEDPIVFATNIAPFWLANGTYSFSIGPVAGYTVNLSAGSFSVRGAPVELWIGFTHNSGAATFLGLPVTQGYALLGGIVAVVLIGALVAVLFRRRQRSPPDPAAPPPGAGGPPARP